MKIIFYAIISCILLTYFGYPLVLFMLTSILKRKWNRHPYYPIVTFIIAAYNEEESIKRKIINTLNLEYPKDKLEIIVASDASTDKTDSIVRSFENKGVKLVSFPCRRGKTFAQNETVRQSRGEIIVFSDATTVYREDLLKKLMCNFADPSVGAVGGELEYLYRKGSEVGEGNGIYWKYERFLKKMESRINSLIGVSGCCYAVRKELYEDIDPELISDFVIAQIVYIKGKRVVYEPEAVSYEYANILPEDEYRMRVRVAVRTINGLWNYRRLLNPFKYGVYSLQLIFHKILRYLIPFFLMLLLMVNFSILFFDSSGFFVWILSMQILFYFAAALGSMGRKERLFSIPSYFCMTNTALLIGILKFIKGEKEVLWEPVRTGS